MLLEGLAQRITELETELAAVKVRLAELDATAQKATSAPTTSSQTATKPTAATATPTAAKTAAK